MIENILQKQAYCKEVEYSAMAESITRSQPMYQISTHALAQAITERPTNKQLLKTAALKAWQTITKEETQRLVMSTGSRIQSLPANDSQDTEK